jgi:hypothetical protein
MKKLLLGLVSVFAAGILSAAGSLTQHIVVPFEFKVDKVSLPAGEYRIEQDYGQYMVSVVNLNTGRRVQVLRDNSDYKPGRARLIFEKSGNTYRLIKVS